LHLPALNAWLLVWPQRLSFDWSMDAVAPVRSCADGRNAATLLFYAGLAWLGRTLTFGQTWVALPHFLFLFWLITTSTASRLESTVPGVKEQQKKTAPKATTFYELRYPSESTLIDVMEQKN